ncbi:hypothetical protein IU438_04945 [Nocardia cyriacigeorgica]|uniref:hypothetical protein n=1 Tax=Nocardia cyriacigeorgica TaxID=135487 RepID=UPI001894F530|nr:hypothetical protein [Nocardia cyriacigeorgica]MBF6091246.1 hypothetical protein [Nocardia cyriacigeorgica]MBF6395130.1 hypothetical protein [Nocardia cyriacigeorgica]MBF6400763.1 hypothetical protein [Nocardia cyriacigeorgica]
MNRTPSPGNADNPDLPPTGTSTTNPGAVGLPPWLDESDPEPTGRPSHDKPDIAASSRVCLEDPGARPDGRPWCEETGAEPSGGPRRDGPSTTSSSVACQEVFGAHPDAEANDSPRPNEPDVHLSVFLHGLRFDFAICPSAATRFITEWRTRHHPGAAAILPTDPRGLPRLPTERLYLL